MSAVMILFAFSLSLVINFIEKHIHHPIDNDMETERKDGLEQYAVEESDNRA